MEQSSVTESKRRRVEELPEAIQEEIQSIPPEEYNYVSHFLWGGPEEIRQFILDEQNTYDNAYIRETLPMLFKAEPVNSYLTNRAYGGARFIKPQGSTSWYKFVHAFRGPDKISVSNEQLLKSILDVIRQPLEGSISYDQESDPTSLLIPESKSIELIFPDTWVGIQEDQIMNSEGPVTARECVVVPHIIDFLLDQQQSYHSNYGESHETPPDEEDIIQLLEISAFLRGYKKALVRACNSPQMAESRLQLPYEFSFIQQSAPTIFLPPQ